MIEPETAEVVRRIFELAATGMNLHRIAKTLQTERRLSLIHILKPTYHRCGDYLLPALTIPDESVTLGKYGRMRKTYLKEHKPIRYRQVLCANSFTSLAELSLHRAGKPALNYLIAEDRERVKGGEARCV